MNQLLAIRNKMKSKKPDFIRQQGRSLSKLKQKWRAPKGMHSKLRMGLRGKIKKPSIGYSSPKEVKGLNRSGYKPVIVATLEGINKIKNGEGIVISRTVGKRKKIELLKKIKELNLIVLNVKNIDSEIKKIEEKKKKSKEISLGKKQEKQEKQVDKKQKEKKEESQEEKEERTKEEKRKLLESKK